MKGILMMIMLIGQALALDVNFDRADVIKENILRGRVSVSCIDGGMNRYETHVCDMSNLAGGNYGIVVVSNGTIDADYVKLQTEGSRYIKGAKFDAKTGKSTGEFNLWIRTLFQRPMLKRGINTINYTFLKNNQVVEEGQFEVSVEPGYDRDCGYGSIYYGSMCPMADRACDDFYYRRNYCQ